MKLKNPPPKNARLTKKFAYEVHAVLKEIEYRIFMSRILERPANGIEFEWRCDIQDRVTAICAHLYSWKENEKRKAQKRKAQNTKGDEEAYNRLNTKSPENVNSEKVIYNGAKVRETDYSIKDIVRDIRRRNHGCPLDAEASHSTVEDLLNLADRIEAAHEREVTPLRETVEMLARVVLPEQEEYPAEYGGGKVPDENEWLGWVRAMQSNAKSALGEKGEMK